MLGEAQLGAVYDVGGDLRGRLVDAVQDVLAEEEIATQQEGSERLADVMLAIVRPVLERQAGEIADHWRAADIDEGTKSELAEENTSLRAERDTLSQMLRDMAMRATYLRRVGKDGIAARADAERFRDELIEVRASREAWAIEAMGLDGLADKFLGWFDQLLTAAAKATGVSVSPGLGNVLPALESIATERGKSQAEIVRLTRERDEARAEAEGFYSATRRLASMFWLDPEAHQTLDVLGSIAEQLAAWRADAAQVPEGWQSLVRKGWSVGASRPAIPADATPRPAMVRAIADHLGRIAASGDAMMPFRQEIQDAADALAGRQGAPGSPWDSWLAPVSAPDTAPAGGSVIVTRSQLIAGMVVGLCGQEGPIPSDQDLERTADLIMRDAGRGATRLLNAIDEDAPPVSSGGDADTTEVPGE